MTVHLPVSQGTTGPAPMASHLPSRLQLLSHCDAMGEREFHSLLCLDCPHVGQGVLTTSFTTWGFRKVGWAEEGGRAVGLPHLLSKGCCSQGKLGNLRAIVVPNTNDLLPFPCPIFECRYKNLLPTGTLKTLVKDPLLLTFSLSLLTHLYP